MSLNHARIVILSGPSGVGKDSVVDRWMQVNPKVERVVAACTRDPREGEVDGEDYHFMSVEGFHDAAAAGRFLEFKEVHGNWYATPWSGIEAIHDREGIAVLKIDVQGAREVLQHHPEIVSVFLMPPSMDELERRIRGRQTDDETAIAKRLQNARDEIKDSIFYRHRLVNDDVDRVVAELEQILEVNEARPAL